MTTSSYAPTPQFRYTPPQKEIDFAQLAATGTPLDEAYALAGYQAAGYSASELRVKAAHLLATERVDERYIYFQKLHAAGMDLTVRRIIQEYLSLSFVDPAEFFAEDGITPRNIHDIPRHVRAAIETYQITKDGALKVRTHDKHKALKALADLKGMFEEAEANRAPKVVVDFQQAPGNVSLPTTIPERPASLDAPKEDNLPEFLR